MVKASDRPRATSVLDEFARYHLLEITELLKAEEVAVNATCVALDTINRGYLQLDNSQLSDPSIGLLLNMLHRNAEHCEGGIVALVTGSAASAEVIIRCSVEASVNIGYILSGDRADRLQAYFNHYFDTTDRQITQWRARIRNLSSAERALHEECIKQRRNSNNSLRQFSNTHFSARKDVGQGTCRSDSRKLA
jgi:hypothetical protein